ncbi:MAG: zf-HC2 domain-containing protein [Acidobacteriota bacterium]
MEHQSAVELRFAERYLLGELSPDETASFEEHFFECAICAEEVRQGAHLVANLKAVLQEAIHEQTIPLGTNRPIEILLKDGFLDLTITLEPRETALRVACEFHFPAPSAPLVMAAFASNGSVRLRLPSDCLPSGACTVVLRDEESKRELGQRHLLISTPV